MRAERAHSSLVKVPERSEDDHVLYARGSELAIALRHIAAALPPGWTCTLEADGQLVISPPPPDPPFISLPAGA